ncbi:MAG: ABC transporter ATP-binding protein [Deltaproteobacteria bacterium]|nr:ABC transporter ATP-binding protein [Deltaproteobacteria bacterium]
MDSGNRRIRDYFGKYRGLFGLGMVCLVITQAFALSAPQLLRMATDGVLARDASKVFEAAGALVAVAVFGGLARVASRVLIFNSGRWVEYDIRNDCFLHLEAVEPAFYQRLPLGQVMSRLVNDLTQVRLLLGPGILNLTNTLLAYLVAIPLLVRRDAWLSLYALSTLPVLLLLGRQFARRMYAYNREAQDRLGALSSKVQENLSGAMTVRAYRQEMAEAERFVELNERYLESNIRLARVRGLMFPLMGLFGAIGSVVVLYFGGQRIISGTMTVGEFVEFNAYLAALTWPTIALGWTISLWQRGVSAMDRLNDIFRSVPEIVDGPGDGPADAPTGAPTGAPTDARAVGREVRSKADAPLSGRIDVRHLTVTYEGASTPALDDIVFTIEPGQIVVLVGRTGSGKSTLLKTLARLIKVPPGTIFMDGIDVLDLQLEQVRRSFGYAPQDAFLFSRTLSDNIAFGDPSASVERVEQATRLASLDADVATFPGRLDTLVGERGITLSGGQRQRATLARALLPGSKILLLDDTLSSVDTETESKILDALTASETSRTLVIATHRLAFAARAHRIIVLERGRIIEQGTEAELLARGGVYARMHRRQRLREAVAGAELADGLADGQAQRQDDRGAQPQRGSQ